MKMKWVTPEGNQNDADQAAAGLIFRESLSGSRGNMAMTSQSLLEISSSNLIVHEP